MHRRLFPFAAIAAGLIAAVAVADSFSRIGGAVNAAGANVIDDFACSIALWPVGGFIIAADESHAVQSSSGNVQFKCQGTIPDELRPARSVKAVGLGCLTQFGYTQDSVNHYTPGGQATLICNINPGH
jgi:hypothetical protein